MSITVMTSLIQPSNSISSASRIHFTRMQKSLMLFIIFINKHNRKFTIFWAETNIIGSFQNLIIAKNSYQLTKNMLCKLAIITGNQLNKIKKRIIYHLLRFILEGGLNLIHRAVFFLRAISISNGNLFEFNQPYSIVFQSQLV